MRSRSGGQGAERYRPGRRRKPVVAFVLDWAAGVLFGVLVALLGFGLVVLLVPPGLERLGALVTATFIAWPLGATIGVWLSVGRPLTGRGLLYAFGMTLLGTAVVLLPFWIDVDADVVRGVSGIAALVLAPVFARLGIQLARKRET